MATMKIDDAERVEEVNGEEVVPVSKGGAPKSVTIGQIKDFAKKAIDSATESDVDIDTDEFLVIRNVGGVLDSMKVDILGVVDACSKYAAENREITNIQEEEETEPESPIMILVNSRGVEKSIDLGTLTRTIKEVINASQYAFDIHKLKSVSTVWPNTAELAVSVGPGSSWSNMKITLLDFVRSICDLIFAVNSQSASSPVETGEVLVRQGNVIVRRTLENLGITKFLKGPSVAVGATVDGRIAQFDGDDGKKVKGALSVTNEITEGSSTSEIAPAAVVKAYVDRKVASVGDVSGPSSSASGSLAVFDGTTGKKIVDSGVSVTNSIGESASDAKIPTEKAVKDAIEGLAAVGKVEEAGTIPTWGEDGKTLDGGLKVVKDISIASSAIHSDDAVPTEKAVRDVLEKFTAKRIGFEDAREEIITGFATGKGKAAMVKSGVAIMPGGIGTTYPRQGDDATVPTTNYVIQEIGKVIAPSTYHPSVFASKILLKGNDNFAIEQSKSEIASSVTSSTADSDVPTIGAIRNAIANSGTGFLRIPNTRPANPGDGAVYATKGSPGDIVELHVYNAISSAWYKVALKRE